MASWLTRLFISGDNRHAKLTADNERELERMAKKLHEPIHGKGNQVKHVDVPERKVGRAKEYGAIEQDEL